MRKTSKSKSKAEDWMRLGTGMAFLWSESATVIWLRSMMFLTGRAGKEEAARMVAEKFVANVDLATKFATMAPRTAREAAQLSVNHYGAKVRANRKRLLDQRFARKIAGS